MNLFACFDLTLAVLSLYVGLYHLVVYSGRRTPDNLHFSWLCLAIALNDLACVGLYNSQSVRAGELWQKAQYFVALGISLGFVVFTYGLIGRKTDIFKRVVQVALGALFVAGLLADRLVLDLQQPMARTVTALGSSMTYYEHKPGLLWNGLFVVQLVGMCWLYGLLIAELRRTRKAELVPLVGAFLVFFGSVVVDMLIAMNVLATLYTVEYAFLLMILAMDYTLIRRFLQVFREVEDLNLGLGEKVEERTREVQALAQELKVANEQLTAANVSLQKRVEHDGMTALLNHAAFHRRLAEVFNLCRRQHFAITVMLLDIDLFKRINDTHGHQMGDQVIAAFAQVLRECSRNYDLKSRYEEPATSDSEAQRELGLTGRYGGDEFVVAYVKCGVAEALIIAERICARVRELAFAAAPELRVTTSIGCAVVSEPRDCKHELALIQLADKALYEAKKAGRDRFVISEWPAPAAS